MNEVLAPGVSLIETSFRAPSIQGVGTSTTGFVGLTRNGPVQGPPRLVTSYGEFERLYGGLAPLVIGGLGAAPSTNYLAMAVRGYFNEGGRRLYISRAFLPAAGTGHAEARLVGTSTADAVHLILRSRFPGSGSNGTITMSEIAAPATAESLASAPLGSLARTRGTPADPARAVAAGAPGAMADGATLDIAVNGDPVATLTFSGDPATATAAGTVATNIDIPAGVVLTLSIDGQVQAVPIAEGLARARTQIRDEITAGLSNGTCSLNGNRFEIESTARGASILISVNQLDVLGFTDVQTPGAGSGLPRLDGITAADINGLLTAANVDAIADTVPGTDLLQISTEDTGTGATLDLTAAGNVAALTALGFNPADVNAVLTGTDGVNRSLYVRATAAADGWRQHDIAGGVFTPGALLDPLPALSADGHLITLSLNVTTVDGVATSYEGLGFDEAHPRWFGHRMATFTDPIDEPLGDPLVLEEDGLNTAQVHAMMFAAARADENDVLSTAVSLEGGNDGTIPALQTMTDAIDNLNMVEDIAIVAAPGSSVYAPLEVSVRNHLIGHAEDSGFRIAVCDPPLGQEMAALRRTRGIIDSNYAALYAPGIRIANPLYRPGDEGTSRELVLPPSGHICGIYARNDAQRGVHKTPANEVVREAVGFERDYNHRQQEVLNPIGVNVLRQLSGSGYRVYGGRLSTQGREVVYVSDRRFLNFLKHSIYQAMQSAVFEPNGPELWSDIRQGVSSFLYTQWRGGALLGASAENAFFVRCDRSVISQDDIDNGRCICEIGVSIIKPAEFLIFRIGQKTADSRG